METAKIDNVDKDDEAYEDTPDTVYGIIRFAHGISYLAQIYPKRRRRGRMGRETGRSEWTQLYVIKSQKGKNGKRTLVIKPQKNYFYDN